MLTKHQHQDEGSAASGVISIGSVDFPALFHVEAVDDQVGGALILAGEEDEDINHDDKSRLTIPDSVPSEMTLNKALNVVDNINNFDELTSVDIKRQENSFFNKPALLALVALLSFASSSMTFGYIKSRTEVHSLKQQVESLEEQLRLQPLSGTECSNDGSFDTANNDTYIFENCYFKVAVRAGECWQAWLRQYTNPNSDSLATGEDFEETFLYHLFESLKSKSLDSYSFVEDGLRNITFDGSYITTILTSSIEAMSGIHKHYGQERLFHESLTSIAKSVVDEGSALARSIEKHASESASRVVDSSLLWLRNVFEVVSEEDIIAWN